MELLQPSPAAGPYLREQANASQHKSGAIHACKLHDDPAVVRQCLLEKAMTGQWTLSWFVLREAKQYERSHLFERLPLLKSVNALPLGCEAGLDLQLQIRVCPALREESEESSSDKISLSNVQAAGSRPRTRADKGVLA